MKRRFFFALSLLFLLPALSFADTRRAPSPGCDTLITVNNDLIYAAELMAEGDFYRYKRCDSTQATRLIRYSSIRGIRYADGRRWGFAEVLPSPEKQGIFNDNEDKKALNWAIASLLLVFPFGFFGMPLLVAPICALVALAKAKNAIRKLGRPSKKARDAQIIASCVIGFLAISVLLLLIILSSL